ncbi:hypothetical protein PENSPDRAFT_685206 [Peniophora sp. CONT]|nr:hypothetical protein PENSPDRAFT_685206 [Peniophora sp. CONT]
MSAQYSALKSPDSGTLPASTWQLPVRSSIDGDSETLLGRSTSYEAGVKENTPRPRLNLKGFLTVPMLLHVGVLAMYVALCVVWTTGAEKNIRVELANASRIQTWINLISHVIMLAFSTAIIAVMQPMATRSALVDLPQPLTVMSDKIASWGGLGSSLLNLYHNLSYPATLNGAIVVTIYFSTLSGLGISSSFLFDVPAVNETLSINMTTRIGSPSVRALIPPSISDMPSNFSNITFDWYRSSVGVGMIAGSNATTYPGLSANRIYDTLSPPMPASSNSTAKVGYTDFNVHCGGVSHVSLQATANIERVVVGVGGSARGGIDVRIPSLLSINYTLGTHNMLLNDSLSISRFNLSYAVGRLWQPADILMRIPSSPLVPGIGRNLVLYNIYNETGFVAGSRPIVDSRGSPGTPWPLTVQLLDDYEEGAAQWDPYPTGLMIQVIGCSLSTSVGEATIDATTNQLLDPPITFEGALLNSTWEGWNPDLTQSNNLDDTWASMFLPGGSVSLWENQPVPLDSAQWSCVNYVPTSGNDTVVPDSGEDQGMDHWNIKVLQKMYQTCHVPTLVEEYLTTQLFGPSSIRYYDDRSPFDSDVLRNTSAARASLSALESALANATAMTMWSAARAGTLTTSTDVLPPEREETSLDERGGVSYDQNGGMGYSTRLEPASGSAPVTEQVLVGRLTFNIPALISGTALAAALTVVGIYMLIFGNVRAGDAPLDDAGLLCLMTLDNSAVASRLSHFSMHSPEARRRAGAFSVRIVDGRLVPADDAEDSLKGFEQRVD